ncbi:hypothetical protein HK100_008897 [Physocladia obscura]|uniref:Uncharacterized protein n=1 Tax=Physocladia obscura TaxID=109957 RepID=A0AAD5T6J3_9FUNG|nr:hypothetical protein HK100_008897 [Physocladia obscura]
MKSLKTFSTSDHRVAQTLAQHEPCCATEAFLRKSLLLIDSITYTLILRTENSYSSSPAAPTAQSEISEYGANDLDRKSKNLTPQSLKAPVTRSEAILCPTPLTNRFLTIPTIQPSDGSFHLKSLATQDMLPLSSLNSIPNRELALVNDKLYQQVSALGGAKLVPVGQHLKDTLAFKLYRRTRAAEIKCNEFAVQCSGNLDQICEQLWSYEAPVVQDYFSKYSQAVKFLEEVVQNDSDILTDISAELNFHHDVLEKILEIFGVSSPVKLIPRDRLELVQLISRNNCRSENRSNSNSESQQHKHLSLLPNPTLVTLPRPNLLSSYRRISRTPFSKPIGQRPYGIPYVPFAMNNRHERNSITARHPEITPALKKNPKKKVASVVITQRPILPAPPKKSSTSATKKTCSSIPKTPRKNQKNSATARKQVAATPIKKIDKIFASNSNVGSGISMYPNTFGFSPNPVSFQPSFNMMQQSWENIAALGFETSFGGESANYKLDSVPVTSSLFGVAQSSSSASLSSTDFSCTEVFPQDFACSGYKIREQEDLFTQLLGIESTESNPTTHVLMTDDSLIDFFTF